MANRGGRDRTIDRIRHLLERSGFFVSDAHHIRPTAFDLIARRDSLLVILKILKNIDALDAVEAQRLHELSRLFNGSLLIVGASSGTTRLESGVVYSRYTIPIVAEETLEDYLARGIPPFLVSSSGGIFARIDGPRLRELREAHRLSLGALASIAGVSRRTIQLYERGTSGEVSVIERIEEYIGEPLVHPIELLRAPGPEPDDDEPDEDDEPDDDFPRPRPDRPRGPIPTGDPVRDGVLRTLGAMGWQVVVTVRCPFDAVSSGSLPGGDELLLTSVGSFKAAQHRAELLREIARVAEGHALYVVTGPADRSSIDGLPILTVPEIRRHRDPATLIEELSDRSGA